MNKPRTRDKTLEKIKTDIDLVSFVISQGYQINKRKTSPNSIFLEKSKDDLVIIAKDTDNHFIYFNPQNRSDSGSILDFVMNKQNKSLWQAKSDLQGLLGVCIDLPKLTEIPNLVKSTKNVIEVLKLYSDLEDISEKSKVSEYLNKERGLLESDYLNERFKGKIKTDHYNAVIFPHFDKNGVIGWEAKNYNFTGCPKGSDKGIWASNRKKTDQNLVITESGLDCLSYYALKNDDITWFISTGGGWSPITEDMLVFASSKVHPGKTVVLAFDNDKAGEEYRKKAKELLKDIAKDIVDDIPENKDWNDDLKEKKYT